MNATERRQRFRAILDTNICVHPASVYDPISARIAGELGFEMLMFAGSIASMAILGAPDLTVITLTEFADQIRRICRVGGPPLLADADHGYGNALNVMRTVEETEHAGLAALTIEDTLLPVAFGSGGKAQMISIGEGVGKMRAALAARQDPSLVIAGRTSAITISGIDEAIARAKAYEAAGVDAMFISGVQSRDHIEALSSAIRIPIILGGAPTTLIDLDYFATKRIRVCLQGHQPFSAAIQAVHDTMKALRGGTQADKLPNIAPTATVKRVTKEADYANWTKDFLGGA